MLAVDRSTTFVSVVAGGASDMAGNPVVELNATTAVVATDYKPDITALRLTSFDIDMTD